jgi:voltage-gated potassium channel
MKPEMNARAERVERFFTIPVIAAALLSLPVIVVEETTVSDPVETVATVLNWAIWLVFVAEVVAMLWVVPNRRRWLGQNPLDVVIIFLTPPVFPPGLQSLRVLRLLRLVRLLKLAQVSRQLFSRQGIRYAALLALLTLIGGGAAFIAAENNQHLSLWDGVWWAFGTMTPAGSAIEPDSALGRMIGIIVTSAGIIFIAYITGAFAERFLAPEIQEEIDEARDEIVFEEQSADAAPASAVAMIGELGESVRALEREVKRLADRS